MSATDFIIGLMGLLIALIAISVIFKKSREYGMRIFLSKEYAILCVGAMLSLFSYFFVQPTNTGQLLGLSLGVMSFSASLFLNVKKSSVTFGAIFTVFQTVMITCFFLIALAVLHWGSQKAYRTE